MNGPPSAGQQVRTGSFVRSGGSIITSWQLPFLFTDRGSQDEISLRVGMIFSFSKKVSFGPVNSCKTLPNLSPAASRSSTPNAMHILFSEPKAFINTGNAVPLFSNKSALPLLLLILSVISAISR